MSEGSIDLTAHQTNIYVTLQTMQIRLREWRKLRGLTQRELANKAGVSAMTVIRLERNAASPSPTLSMLERLAQVLGIAVTDLLPKKKPRRRS